jgi:hypothetical protein
MEKTIRKVIKIEITRTVIFFETISTPRILAIASKFANLRARECFLLNDVKWMKIINGNNANKIK